MSENLLRRESGFPLKQDQLSDTLNVLKACLVEILRIKREVCLIDIITLEKIYDESPILKSKMVTLKELKFVILP